MGNELADYKNTVFEQIKHHDEEGMEYWSARELSKALEYNSWQNFVNVIRKAMLACSNSGMEVADHFNDTIKMIEAGKGAQREIIDYELSRYACYLIVQNGDPAKEVIALGQTYFSIKTREQEIAEEYAKLTEDEKRLRVRESIRSHNIELSNTANESGVVDHAQFTDAGYMGLYNGETAGDIRKRKQLKPGQKILDWMNGSELGANLFRITQTDAKIRRERLQGQSAIDHAHHEVGRRIRQTIQDLGGTMPEDEPKPDKSIQQLEAKKRKSLPPEETL